MKDVGGAGFAGSSPSFLGRQRAALNVDVGPERRSPRYHETGGVSREETEKKKTATSTSGYYHQDSCPRGRGVRAGRRSC